LKNKDNEYIRKCYKVKVDKIREYLINNLEDNVTNAQLSEKFDITMTLMKKCFKCMNGIPINAFIRNEKMKLAADLLKNTKHSVTEIAGKVGYNNSSKFSAAFKNITGMSPIEYRKSDVRLEHLRLNGVEEKNRD